MKRLIILINIIILSGCSNGGLFNRGPKESIDAVELGIAYEENKSLASEDYNDLYIQITGVIKFIFESNDETSIHFYGGVVCSVTENFELIEDLSKFNMVVFNGTVEGIIDVQSVDIVSVEDCEFVEQITHPEIVTTAEQASSLNLGEIGYVIIEITGDIYSFDFGYRYGFDFVTDDVYDLGVDFEDGFDLLELDVGDTVTIIGVVMPYDSFLSPNGYKIYGYEITEVIKNN